eukprot:SAG31_NODE_4625_length_3087_cov_8.343039_5_plen_166_part_00
MPGEEALVDALECMKILGERELGHCFGSSFCSPLKYANHAVGILSLTTAIVGTFILPFAVVATCVLRDATTATAAAFEILVLSLSCCHMGVGIAKFVFLLKFTVDVGEVDLECDADKYSAMDTWLIMAWVEWGTACCCFTMAVVVLGLQVATCLECLGYFLGFSN